ncbi:hypothetical protein U0070_002296, partial [Myodes glareolus]
KNLKAMRNHYIMTQVILMGNSRTERVWELCFVLFLSFYIFNLLRNLLIILAIVSSTMLFPLSGNSKAVFYSGCVCLLFFYNFFGCTECLMYTIIAFDHFMVICHSLKHSIIVNHNYLSYHSYIPGAHCGPNGMENFFCDKPTILKLTGSENSALEKGGLINMVLKLFRCFLLIIILYSFILQSI